MSTRLLCDGLSQKRPRAHGQQFNSSSISPTAQRLYAHSKEDNLWEGEIG
eukprot:CAMPEP_0204028132 /NCGR_PEP_ID=MMETSP0360-20130528/52499_1 /ASSEMBLY_ACC=CAM_ASM_000342 /TAXON_ID=268821 /ORGANISM="Scrippsiella Hangoei, Strain SHTV-5" /LENGTH=49 /DNA_ID= /DNA_START= /DNA_END= /DNA_ORIENTATION=